MSTDEDEDSYDYDYVLELKVQVHDGAGFRAETISSAETFNETREKLSGAMKRPSRVVELGYEAGWSQKIGTKKCPTYVTNDQEYKNFWMECKDQDRKAKASKKGTKNPLLGIVFRNMFDEAQVSLIGHNTTFANLT